MTLKIIKAPPTKSEQGNVIGSVSEVFMDKDLADSSLLPGKDWTNENLEPFGTQPPVSLLGLPPVVKAKHHGERGGRQHLLVVVLVQAVSRCQGKSVSNLRGRNFEQRNLLKQSESMIF